MRVLMAAGLVIFLGLGAQVLAHDEPQQHAEAGITECKNAYNFVVKIEIVDDDTSCRVFITSGNKPTELAGEAKFERRRVCNGARDRTVKKLKNQKFVCK